MKATSVLGNMFGGGDDDPKKKPTPKMIADANAFARSFGARKLPFIGENLHTGNTVAPFIDAATGMDISGIAPPPIKLPFGTITDPRMIPSYVTDKDIIRDDPNNVPYFINQETGDMQYIHPDLLTMRRFNPNRGMYDFYAKNK